MLLETGGNMSLDCQVLVIAFLAISLRLFLWATEPDEVNANRANARSARPQDLVATVLGSKVDK